MTVTTLTSRYSVSVHVKLRFAGVACVIVATNHQQILLSSDTVAIITLLLLS